MGSHYLSDPEMTADTAAKYSVWVRDLSMPFVMRPGRSAVSE